MENHRFNQELRPINLHSLSNTEWSKLCALKHILCFENIGFWHCYFVCIAILNHYRCPFPRRPFHTPQNNSVSLVFVTIGIDGTVLILFCNNLCHWKKNVSYNINGAIRTSQWFLWIHLQ